MPQSLEANPDLWGLASPIKRAANQKQPFFVIHGALDTLAFAEEARLFMEALREKGSSVASYAELKDTQHAFDLFNSPHSIITVKYIQLFCEVIYSDFLLKN